MAHFEEDRLTNLSKMSLDSNEIPFYNQTYIPLQTVTTKSGSTLTTDDHFNMVLWAQLSWTALFSVMLVVAIGGNAIVIWIVVAHRRMRSVTNYFLVNLSTADLLMSVLNCLFNFIYMVHSDWQFGEKYCTISNFIAVVSVAASVFTLTGISCDRYLAIVHPLQPRITKKAAISTIILIWMISITLGIPCLLYSRTVSYTFHERIRISCILIWPDGMPTVSEYDYAYQITFFVTTYFIPMSLMVWSYSAMGVVLWGSKSIGEMTQRQMDSIRSKRKVVRMFIIVVIIFGVCWLPYHIYFIYTHYNKAILYSKYVQHIYLGFYWFAMANAMVNPLIYYWMNARFRKYFNTVLCGWRRLLLKSSYHSENTENSTPGRKSYNNSKFSDQIDSQRSQVHLTHNCSILRHPQVTSNSLVLHGSFKKSTNDISEPCACKQKIGGLKQSKSV